MVAILKGNKEYQRKRTGLTQQPTDRQQSVLRPVDSPTPGRSVFNPFQSRSPVLGTKPLNHYIKFRASKGVSQQDKKLNHCIIP